MRETESPPVVKYSVFWSADRSIQFARLLVLTVPSTVPAALYLTISPLSSLLTKASPALSKTIDCGVLFWSANKEGVCTSFGGEYVPGHERCCLNGGYRNKSRRRRPNRRAHVLHHDGTLPGASCGPCYCCCGPVRTSAGSPVA